MPVETKEKIGKKITKNYISKSNNIKSAHQLAWFTAIYYVLFCHRLENVVLPTRHLSISSVSSNLQLLNWSRKVLGHEEVIFLFIDWFIYLLNLRQSIGATIKCVFACG